MAFMRLQRMNWCVTINLNRYYCCCRGIRAPGTTYPVNTVAAGRKLGVRIRKYGCVEAIVLLSVSCGFERGDRVYRPRAGESPPQSEFVRLLPDKKKKLFGVYLRSVVKDVFLKRYLLLL